MPTFLSFIDRVAHLPLSAVSGYQFDFFVSYSRQGSVQKWLLNHFYSKLVECLADECAPAPMVYMARYMPRAVEWSHNLQTSLRYSKIMIQVMTPHFKALGAKEIGREEFLTKLKDAQALELQLFGVDTKRSETP
jgi:hypothetical protein